MINAAYICVECGWEYPIGDVTAAIRRHQLTHFLEQDGWTGAVNDVAESLIGNRKDFSVTKSSPKQ